MIFFTALWCFGSRYNANLMCDLYMKRKQFIIKWKPPLNIYIYHIIITYIIDQFSIYIYIYIYIIYIFIYIYIYIYI